MSEIGDEEMVNDFFIDCICLFSEAENVHALAITVKGLNKNNRGIRNHVF